MDIGDSDFSGTVATICDCAKVHITITNIFKIKLLSYNGTELLRLFSFVAPPRIYLMMSLFRLGVDLPHLLLGGCLYPCSFREKDIHTDYKHKVSHLLLLLTLTD